MADAPPFISISFTTDYYASAVRREVGVPMLLWDVAGIPQDSEALAQNILVIVHPESLVWARLAPASLARLWELCLAARHGRVAV